MRPGFRQRAAMVATLVRREVLKLRSERARIFGLVAQPIVLWIVFSFGFDAGFGSSPLPQSQGDFFAYFFPGVVVMTILFGSVFASMTIIEDRSGGFLQGAMAAPSPAWVIMLGKSLGVMTVVLLQAAVVCLVGALMLGKSWDFDPMALLAWSMLSTFALVPANLAVALYLNSTQAFHGFMGVVLFPAWAFSGALFPMQGTLLGAVALANPLTYMVNGLRSSFIATDSGSASPAVGPLLLVAIGIFGLVAATVSLRRTAHSL